MSVCVSVCLSAAVRPHYCTDPDVTWGHVRGCPLVVHYWVDLQSGHGLRCYGNITRTLVTSLRPSRDMTTKPRAAYGKRARPACCRRGVLNITAAVCTAGFHWWRSGNKKRTQNVSEYMLVLALCLVDFSGGHLCFESSVSSTLLTNDDPVMSGQRRCWCCALCRYTAGSLCYQGNDGR